MEFLQHREHQGVHLEEAAMRKIEETEVDPNLILDERRCATVGQANHELNRCEAKAENWKQQLRQQDVELLSRSQFFEKSRREQYLLFAELQSLERAHGETLAHMREEVEVLRKTRRSEAELREEANQDTLWHEGANIWNTEPRESQSTVNKLTPQIRELQEVLKFLE